MKEIALRGGLVALVDDADFEAVNRFAWSAYRYGAKQTHLYAARRENDRMLMMHRFILDAAKGAIVDHINHNGLDNQRANLRFCTHQENMRNRKKGAGGLCPFKGVEIDSTPGHGGIFYRARIRVLGKIVRGRRFRNVVEAAQSYDRLAIMHFGEFACTNFPREQYT